MKKIITSILVLGALIASPKYALAQQTCVTQYGGGVVCGASTPQETVFYPKPTAIGDINLPVIGIGFMFGSIALFYFSKKFNKVL